LHLSLPVSSTTSSSPTKILDTGPDCPAWQQWSTSYTPRFAIYIVFALFFGIISSSLTILTKRSLPAVSAAQSNSGDVDGVEPSVSAEGKSIYMAAGSGIPEIKTILSGFVIPNFLDCEFFTCTSSAHMLSILTRA
jgi:chloride channel 3/4/5